MNKFYFLLLFLFVSCTQRSVPGTYIEFYFGYDRQICQYVILNACGARAFCEDGPYECISNYRVFQRD